MEIPKEVLFLISNEVKDIIFILNEKFEIEYINEKELLKQLGYLNKDLINKKFSCIISNEDFNKICDLISTLRYKDEKFVEIQISQKEGEKKWFEVKVKSIEKITGVKKFLLISRDISQKKWNEHTLKDSKEKYQSLIENIKEGYFEVDLKGNFKYVNDAFCKFFGYSKNEIINKNYEMLNDKDANKLIYETYNKVFRTEINQNIFQFPALKKNGEKIIVESSVYLKYDSEDRKVGFYGILRDITERKKEEDLEERFKIELEQKVKARAKELKESEEKYSNLFQHSNDGIFVHTLDGKIIDVNQKVLDLLSYTKEEILALNISQLHPLSDQMESQKAFDQISKKGVIRFEIKFKKKNGESFPAEVSSSIYSVSGKKFIQGIIRDITIRKEIELKLKESESRYRNLFESVPFSIALIDQKGTIVYCNPAVETLLGYSVQEVIGYEFRKFPAIHPKYIPMMVIRFEEVIKGATLPAFEAVFYKKNGDLIWISYQTSLVKLGDNVLILAILHDITDRKKADVLVQEEIQKLKELDQIRKDLISRVSHELKTPLVSVCGASELLLNMFKDQFKEDSKELIEMIEKGGKRLKYLVDNLLDITRIEYKKFELEKEIYNLSKIIEDCANELMYQIRNRNLILKLDLPNEINIEVDKIRIEHVILNLLSNAIKNTPPKGTIEIILKKSENWAIIHVRDTGIGLTREEMEVLFTRFGKIERYGEGLEYIDIQGSGLGLFISKEIIDLHGGNIRAESRGRNKGSSFYVKLPMN
ncbi:MAG: PAS domain S-box protein [Promethearchaeota archaeon]